MNPYSSSANRLLISAVKTRGFPLRAVPLDANSSETLLRCHTRAKGVEQCRSLFFLYPGEGRLEIPHALRHRFLNGPPPAPPLRSVSSVDFFFISHPSGDGTPAPHSCLDPFDHLLFKGIFFLRSPACCWFGILEFFSFSSSPLVIGTLPVVTPYR